MCLIVAVFYVMQIECGKIDLIYKRERGEGGGEMLLTNESELLVMK